MKNLLTKKTTTILILIFSFIGIITFGSSFDFEERIKEKKPVDQLKQLKNDEMYFMNFRINNWEIVKRGEIPSEKFRDFLPQIPVIQNIFQTYIAMGNKPIDAYLKTADILLDEVNRGRENSEKLLSKTKVDQSQKR